MSEHVKPGGWYSHSVLGRALLTATDSQLLFNALEKTAYDALMADEGVTGAVVNQDNKHWIAMVKHNGLLWEVDSQKAPALMDQQAFRATVQPAHSTRLAHSARPAHSAQSARSMHTARSAVKRRQQ